MAFERQSDQLMDGLLGVFNKADDTMMSATFPFWRRVAQQRGVEMFKVSTMAEQLELNQRLADLFENAIDIKIAGGNLTRLIGERLLPPDTRVLIARTPEGSAPKKFRLPWIGVNMPAYKLPAGEELDPLSGKPLQEQRQTRNIYAVELGQALQSLGNKSPEAANWWGNNVAPGVGALTFRSKEVLVLP